MLGSSSSEPLLGVAATWPVIGRERELETIAQARVKGAHGVVLYAPAGVGRSRLAREALTEAESEIAVTAWVQGTRSAASMPLGAFAGVIPPEVRADSLFELMRRGTEAMRELAERGIWSSASMTGSCSIRSRRRWCCIWSVVRRLSWWRRCAVTSRVRTRS